jgi:hypothetical protein
MSSPHRLIAAAILSVVCVAGSGCTALVAKSRIIAAEAAVASARRAGAESRAAYEFTGAVLYLEKAKEEEAYSRFGSAFDFGGVSETLAEQAKLKAVARDAEPPPPANIR